MENGSTIAQARELLKKVSEALEWTLNEVLIEFIPDDSLIGQIMHRMPEIERFKTKSFSDFLDYITENSDVIDLADFLNGDMDPVNIFAVLIPIYENLE